MLGIGSLNQYFSLFIFSSRPTADLLHHLESSFINTKVCKTQDAVGIYNADELYIVKVQTFHHHLGANKYVDSLLFEQLNEIVMCGFSADTVNIHSCNFRIGENFFQVLFDLFGSEIPLHELMIATGKAGIHRWISGSAIMAL